MSATASASGGPSFWLVAPVVAMAAFMEVLDISIANVALPHIAGSLASSQDEATWVLTSYLVANAIVLTITGWLSTVFERKRLFLFCIAGFGVASLLCGMAPSLGALVCFRALQGLVGGGLQPFAQAILSDAAPPSKRGIAFALYGIAVVFAPAIGPTLGGWITDHYSWRWVFLINVPVAIALFMAATAIVKEPEYLKQQRAERRTRKFRFDGIGFSLLALGLGTLQVVLDRGQDDDWLASPFILVMALVSLIALVCFVVWELGDDDPIVDLRLLGIRNFGISAVLMFALGFMLLASTLLIPQMAQQLFGYNATAAGMILSPGGFAMLLCMPFIGRLVQVADARILIAIGFLIAGLATLQMTTFYIGVDQYTMAKYRIYQAIGLAFLFVPINVVSMGAVPPARIGNASALINLARNLGSSFGTSVVTTILDRRSQYHQSTLIDHLGPLDRTYQHTLTQSARVLTAQGHDATQAMLLAVTSVGSTLQQQASMLSYLDNFKALGVGFLVLVPLAFFLKRVQADEKAMAAH